MTETVREWVAKAEGDFATARRELSAKEEPNFDAVCFHAQQCVEKLMKAVLIANGVTPPRTHDLAELNRLITEIKGDWASNLAEVRFLSRAAVEFRYPGESAGRDEAARSFEIADRLRARLREALPA